MPSPSKLMASGGKELVSSRNDVCDFKRAPIVRRCRRSSWHFFSIGMSYVYCKESPLSWSSSSSSIPCVSEGAFPVSADLTPYERLARERAEDPRWRNLRTRGRNGCP